MAKAKKIKTTVKSGYVIDKTILASNFPKGIVREEGGEVEPAETMHQSNTVDPNVPLA